MNPFVDLTYVSQQLQALSMVLCKKVSSSGLKYVKLFYGILLIKVTTWKAERAEGDSWLVQETEPGTGGLSSGI